MSDQSRRESQEKWSLLIAQAASDESLKRRLKENPRLVLEEHGINVRPGVEVRVVENTDEVAYLTLPAAPVQRDLKPNELDAVTGGLTPRKAGGSPQDY